MDQPPIIVTETDYERIDALLEKNRRQCARHTRVAGWTRARSCCSPDEISADVVTMNSTIAFENVDSGKRFELALVYPKDMDGSPGKVSILAPVGSALLGLAVDQMIQWQVPGGDTLKLRVL